MRLERVRSVRSEFTEAFCGYMVLPGGLGVGESVKVTTNGWTEEHKDFQVVLVSDHSSKLNKLASGAAEASEHNGSDTGTQIKTDDEKPSVPIVGVRIPGYKDEEEERSHAAVLLYKDPSAPTEIPLDTIANPKTPLMVLFEHSSPTEVTVTVYTWKSEYVSTLI